MQDWSFWSVSLPCGCVLTSSQHSLIPVHETSGQSVCTRADVLCFKAYSCVLQTLTLIQTIYKTSVRTLQNTILVHYQGQQFRDV
jgi:hypothetical protein